jgi:hypothetical protein
MNTAARILNAHAFFAPTGFAYTTPSSGTVGRDTKPPTDAADGASLAAWFDLGIIESATENITAAGIAQIKKVVNGRKMLYQEIPHGEEKQFTIVCKELHALALQLLKGALDLDRTAATTDIQYNQLEGSILVEGWLKLQYVDTNGNTVDVCDQYGAIRFEGDYTINGENTDYTLVHKLWYSQYNSGELMPS